ncbi:MAG TPA: hypothetical protein VN673_12520 [Clostridia bacterium]|nr:hypothetical protein [Clostridia bacterium]
MQISNLVQLKDDGVIRVQADLRWEDSEHAPLTLFVQTDVSHEDALWPDPNSFLIATVLSAWQSGEKRILVEGALCPALASNLQGVFMMLRAWYPDDFDAAPKIEAAGGFKTSLPYGKGALSLMSGGIDSLCLLRANKLFFPAGHANGIRAVLSIAQIAQPVTAKEALQKKMQGRLSAISPVAADAGVDVIPALTNTWWLNPDGYFYGQKAYSSQLSAVTSFFSKRFQKGYIASSYDAAFTGKPWGSHPQLDAYYSSSHFEMQNSGTEMTRLRKVEMVADWPVALHHMRVCQNDNTGGKNCGTCEKCIRTLLMLEGLGKLRDCQAFPKNTITPELVRYLEAYDMLHSEDMLHDEEKLHLYEMILPLLEQRGRHDLASTLREILTNLASRKGDSRAAEAVG